MPKTKRYDVGGMDRGDGTKYPAGTILKLTEERAKQMGATKESKMTTTADNLSKRAAYDEAMTSQDRMRATEGKTVDTKKRGAKNKSEDE